MLIILVCWVVKCGILLTLMTNVYTWTFHNALNWKIEHLLDRLHTWDSSSSICRHQHTSSPHLAHMVCCKWILGVLSYHLQTGHLQQINSMMYTRLLYYLCFHSFEANMKFCCIANMGSENNSFISFHMCTLKGKKIGACQRYQTRSYIKN